MFIETVWFPTLKALALWGVRSFSIMIFFFKQRLSQKKQQNPNPFIQWHQKWRQAKFTKLKNCSLGCERKDTESSMHNGPFWARPRRRFIRFRIKLHLHWDLQDQCSIDLDRISSASRPSIASAISNHGSCFLTSVLKERPLLKKIRNTAMYFTVISGTKGPETHSKPLWRSSQSEEHLELQAAGINCFPHKLFSTQPGSSWQLWQWFQKNHEN